MSKDLLIEIGTEELPPNAMQRLSNAFTHGVAEGLSAAGFETGEVYSYATPRRLAVLIRKVPGAQPDREVERKGPSLKAAYDSEGRPTKAVEGFARSCGVSVDALEQEQTDKGTWLVFRSTEKGQGIADLVPEIVTTALARLPIPKRMRWGDSDAEFVRPVHWVVMMHSFESTFVFVCSVPGQAMPDYLLNVPSNFSIFWRILPSNAPSCSRKTRIFREDKIPCLH